MRRVQRQDFLHRKVLKSEILRETNGIIDRAVNKVKLGTLVVLQGGGVARIVKDKVQLQVGVGEWREVNEIELRGICLDARDRLDKAKLRLQRTLRKAKASRVCGDKQVRASRLDGKWNRNEIARLGKIVLALENIGGNENGSAEIS